MHNFTNHDLLLYVLNEANSDTAMAIDKAMQSNDLVKNEIRSLKVIIDKIDNFEMQPDDKVMNFILQDLFVEENKTAIA